MKKIKIIGLFVFLLTYSLFLWTKTVQAERRSARPKMIEVEEELWFKLNQDLLKMKDELLKSKTEVKVLQSELDNLKRLQRREKALRVHRVRKNESLWKIAIKYYNDPFKWRWIYKANINQIDDPDLIYPEQILDIPTY